MEPMEALRYLPYLSRTGRIITSDEPFINIPNYPDPAALTRALDDLPRVSRLPIERLAREAGSPRSANIVLLGLAAPYLNILSADELRAAIDAVFGSKGEAIVEMNHKAFDIGRANG